MELSKGLRGLDHIEGAGAQLLVDLRCEGEGSAVVGR